MNGTGRALGLGLVWLLNLSGCAEPAAEQMPPEDNTPHVDLVGEYSLKPGEEKYLCYTLRVPKGMEQAVTRLVPTYGVGTHHILFSQTLTPEPAGQSECAVLSKETWLPLYAGGKESGILSSPAGTAMRLIEPEQQLLMQLHLQNASPNPLTAKTKMRVEFAPSSQGLTWAGLYGLDNRVITLPANSKRVKSSMSCVMDKELNVFAIMGHMHKQGRSLLVSRGGTSGAEVLYQEAWNFDLQPVTPITMQIRKGDTISLDCEHDNDSDKPVVYGESSDTEMCAVVFYYTPFNGLDGCIKS